MTIEVAAVMTGFIFLSRTSASETTYSGPKFIFQGQCTNDQEQTMVLSCDELTCMNDYLSVRVRATHRQPTHMHFIYYVTFARNSALNYPRLNTIFNTPTNSIHFLPTPGLQHINRINFSTTTAVSFQNMSNMFHKFT